MFCLGKMILLERSYQVYQNGSFSVSEMDECNSTSAGCAWGPVGALYVLGMVAFAASPETTDVGYQPEQPLPFSHALHAGKLKLDCRYCHNTVEVAGHAAIPPTSTCLNCHSGAGADGVVNTVSIHSTSSKLAPIRESQATGKSMQWRRVHDLPDYVFF